MVQRVKTRPPRMALRLFFAALAFSALWSAGCATRTELADESEPAIAPVWPDPPDPPRIRYLRSVGSTAPFLPRPTFGRRVARLFTGDPVPERPLRPYGVLVDEADRLFVADPGEGSVRCYDLVNRRTWRFAQPPAKPLQSPIGLARDESGRLFVSDSVSSRVCLFNPDGSFVRVLDTPGELLRPTGLAYESQTHTLFVSDTLRHCVWALSPDGKETFRFGRPGTGDGELNAPTDLCLSPTGELFVTDSLNFRVQVFSVDGKPLRVIGRQGTEGGSFSRPKGVAVDAAGHLYVVDAAFENVQIFDAGGRLLLAFGSEGSQAGEFWLPTGVFVSHDNRIYVSDSFNRRIQIFQLLPGENP